MKRLLLIVAVLFGLTLAAAPPAHAWGHHGHPRIYTRFYCPYYYGPYGPPAYGYMGGYPSSPGFSGYPGFPLTGSGIY